MDFLDGGIVDVDNKTIIIAPVHGQFINPAICPVHKLEEEGDDTSTQEPMHKLSLLYLQLTGPDTVENPYDVLSLS